MLQKILQIIAKEDTFKLFTGPTSPSIYDAYAGIQEPIGLHEIQRTLGHFFTSVMQKADPTTFYYTEAARMLTVVDKIFAEIQKEYMNFAPARPPRDANDEVVDLYLESLNYFAAGLDEPVLREHICYLER